ncbi:MAG: glycosyltransferase family 2 protein [Anaerolineales bacterium]
MTSPTVAVIVLNWNGLTDTLACVASLLRCDYSSATIVVVDNGSTDDSVTGIRAAFSQVTVLETGCNLGYVGGNNFGLEHARQLRADYALLLNNDTEVAPDFITRLVEVVQADPQIGIAGPFIYYHVKPTTFWSVGGQIDWRRGHTSMLGEGQPDAGQFGDQPFPVEFVTGCALLIRSEVMNRIGLLEERFFAYYEDTEWCVRARRAGYRVLSVPAAKVLHKITPEARFASNSLAYYLTRNRLLFLKLSHASSLAWAYTLLMDIGRTLLSYSLRPKWRHKQLARRAMLRGLLDFWRGQFGPMPAELRT